MKKTFKKFALMEATSSSPSITHVEDLDIETFIRMMDQLDKLEAVQKLDGANLRAGVDKKDRFFTSREQKGGKRFYDLKDFPKTSAYDGFRAAHAVLEKNQEIIRDILAPGEAMNLEVIYGGQPNTVFYGKEGFNYLAILEMLPGDDPTIIPDQSKVSKIVKAFENKIITVKTEASDTADGMTLSRAPRITDWKITSSDRVPSESIKSLNLDDEISKMKKFLEDENKTAKKLGMEMTNFEVIKDKTRALSDERDRLSKVILSDYKLPIKKKLMSLATSQKPSLRAPQSPDHTGAYHGIEGIIFIDPKTREKFKVVDRDVFTKINQFNYQVRKTIAGRITSANPDLPIEARGGLVGEAKVRSLKLFNIPNLELPSQATRVLEKFKGEDKNETVHNIAHSLRQLDFQAIKRKIQSIYVTTLDDLDEALNGFKTHGDEYELKLNNGQKIKYTPEIRRRTMMVFAEARRDVMVTMAKIKKCNDMYDLLEIFLDRHLEQLHRKVEDEDLSDVG